MKPQEGEKQLSQGYNKNNYSEEEVFKLKNKRWKPEIGIVRVLTEE